MSAILTWILERILAFILGKLTSLASKKIEEIKQDHERGNIDEENIKKYEEAKSRADRIRAATDLLNGVRGP